MALMKCPECGKEICNKASACPHCGVPMKAGGSIADPEFHGTGDGVFMKSLIGITKEQSATAQKLADIPDEVFRERWRR
jgi:hypothetical protein